MGNSLARISSDHVLNSDNNSDAQIEPSQSNNINMSRQDGRRDPEANRGNRVLAHVTQEGMLFGPFFQLADSQNDLVPFAQLMETEESSNGLVDRVLQMLLDDGQAGGGSGVADVLPVEVWEGALNVVGDSLHLRKDGSGFELTASVLSREVSKCHGTLFINGDAEIGSFNISTDEQSISLDISNETLLQVLELQNALEQPVVAIAPIPSAESSKTVLTLVITALASNQLAQKLIMGLEIVEHETNSSEEKHYTIEVVYKKYEINGQTFMLQDIYGFVDTISTSPSPLTIRQDAELSQQIPSSSASSVTGAVKPNIDFASLSVADCVICMSEPKCVMALPCRHMCLCRDCADIIRQQQHGKCPICRQPFYSLLQISRTLPTSDTAITIPS